MNETLQTVAFVGGFLAYVALIIFLYSGRDR